MADYSISSYLPPRSLGYTGIKCNKFKIALILCFLSIAGLLTFSFLVFQFEIAHYYPLNYLSDVYVHHDTQALQECSWNPTSSYTVMVLKTKLNVQYDAGQWFHMTENFLVHQPRLAQRRELLNSSRIIYLFDEDNFEKGLNDYTRFIIRLSTLADPETPREVHFHSSSAIAKVFTRTSRNQGVLLPVERGRRVCARFHGSIGGEVIPRSEWFRTPEDIPLLRKQITRFCQSQKKVSVPQKQKKYRLTIYQRDHSRVIANEEFMLATFSELFPSTEWEISVLRHSNQRSTCELIASLSTTDLLFTPHGFQSISLLFLPIPSMLFELFPYYYYKQVYKHIATSMGLIYDHAFSQPSSIWYALLLAWVPYRRCAKSIVCRTIVRGQNVIFERKHAIQIKQVFEKHQLMFQTIPHYHLDHRQYAQNTSSNSNKTQFIFQPKERNVVVLM